MKPENKTYSYQTPDGREINLVQHELTLGQKQDLILVLSDIGLEPDATEPLSTFANMKIEDLFKLLSKNNVLARVLQIIAPPGVDRSPRCLDTSPPTGGDTRQPVKERDYLDMPYSVTRQIISDFFFCNSLLCGDIARLFAPIASTSPDPAKGGRSASPKSFTNWLAAILQKRKQSET